MWSLSGTSPSSIVEFSPLTQQREEGGREGCSEPGLKVSSWPTAKGRREREAGRMWGGRRKEKRRRGRVVKG